MRVLGNKSEDGKLILTPKEKLIDFELKYLSLNPGNELKRIIDDSHATVFISGTLEPVRWAFLTHVDGRI